MTNTSDTTAVPTEMLIRLKNSITRRTNDGWVQETYITGPVVNELLRLIPEPVKVGDTLSVAQVKALPPLSVLRDNDGDVWVTKENGGLVMVGRSSGGVFDVDKDAEAWETEDYSPTLISLPEDAE